MFAKAIFSAERRKFDFRGLLRSFDRALVGHFLDLCRRSFVKLLLRGRGWPRFPETSWACGHWYTVSCILSLGGSFISDIDMFRANAFSITCPLTLCRGVTKAYENFFSFPNKRSRRVRGKLNISIRIGWNLEKFRNSKDQNLQEFGTLGKAEPRNTLNAEFQVVSEFSLQRDRVPRVFKTLRIWNF